jgi:hypothetical protein
MWRKFWKGFHNMSSKKVSNKFSEVDTSVYIRKGNFFEGNVA